MKTAIILLGVILLIALIRLPTLVDWLSGSGSEPAIVVASPAEVATVIEDLGPGDTLHFVRIQYKAEVPNKSACPAGSIRHESWETFGMDGALVSLRTEARTEDGALCSAGEILEGEVACGEKDATCLVFFDSEGRVYERLPFRRVTDERLKPPTLETRRAAVRQAQVLVFEALAEQSVASEALGNEQVVVWEELDGDVMRRHTILPDVGFEVQTETLQVVDGREVLVESTLYEVYEVISANASD